MGLPAWQDRGSRARFGDRRVILSVDRLDPSKGILQKLHAYDRFLRLQGDLIGHVQFVLGVGPCRMDVEAYRSLDRQIVRTVTAINKRFGREGWNPIEFMHRNLSYDELLALYRVADVSLVTPVADGMNLMAKEYLYVKGSDGGALVLSKRAGAAVELNRAYLVEPTDTDDIVGALARALRADPRELTARNRTMLKQLSVQTAARWAGDFLAALKSPVSWGAEEPGLRHRSQKSPT